MPSDDPGLKSSVEAAHAVVSWLAQGGAGRLTLEEVAETAISFHSALIGIDEGDDLMGLGLRSLIGSLLEYTAAHGVEFDLLLMEIEAHVAVRGPSVDRISPISDEDVPADAGTRRLLLTLHEYAAKRGLDLGEMIFDLLGEHPAPSQSFGASL